MDFNLFFDIAALTILAFLIFSIILKKQIIGSSNKFYLVVIFTTLIATTLDILASLDFFSIGLLFTLNAFFLFFRAGIAFVLFFYTLNLAKVYQRFRNRRFWYLPLFIPLLVLFVCLIINYFNKFLFDYLPGPTYQRGDFMWIAYLVGFLYFASSIVVVIFTKKYFLKPQIIAMFVAISAQILAQVFQYFVGSVLIEMFVDAITLLTLSLFIESPENFIDFKTRALNYRSFTADVQQELDIKATFSVLFIKVTNSSTLYNLFPYKQVVKFNRSCSASVVEKARKLDKSTLVYFLGNETFAYVFNNKKLEDDIVQLVRDEFAKPMIRNDMSFQFVAKTCLVNCPEDCNNVADLVAFSTTFFDLTDDDHLDIKPFRKEKGNLLFELDHILERSIEEKTFTNHYQGIYSIKEKKFIAAESLIRLKNPDFGMIMPSLMIPYAEGRGKNSGIGRVVIEKAFKFFSTQLKGKLKYIEINLSPSQLLDTNLVKDVTYLARQYDIQPEEVIFEILESTVATDDPNIDKNFKELRELGYRFAIDDFGTGYSNLSRIMHLDIAILKFDRTMSDLLKDDAYDDFFRGLIPIFHRRKIKVVFEGVETKEVVDKLESMKADYIQGYYFSKTIPEEEFIELINNN